MATTQIEIKNAINCTSGKADQMGSKQTASMHSVSTALNASYADAHAMDGGGRGRTGVRRGGVCRHFRLKYVLNVAFGVLAVTVISAVQWCTLPYVRLSYRCKDPALSHPFRGDSINLAGLGAITIVLPAAIFALVEYLRAGSAWRRVAALVWRWSKFHLIGCNLVTLFMAQVLKSALGAPRPHFFATCTPNVTECATGDIVEYYRCTNTQYPAGFVQDSARSFPSAHAAVGLFVSIYCATYIHYRLRNLRVDLGSLFKPILIACVLLVGPICGLSRIADRRHHWWDVLAGFVLGAVTALYAVYGMAEKFRVEERRCAAASASCVKLCDENNKADGAGDVIV